GSLRFRLVPAKVADAKEAMDKRANLLRYLLISVDEKALIADAKAAEAKLAHREATEKAAAEGGEVSSEGEQVAEAELA
ncbi:MAG TPA: hypothetical protein VFA15_06210, partial [Nitrososphaera sp.]|nr:hypothetical protein [Nitrososphaera sp.]